jgi:hypothetical protein
VLRKALDGGLRGCRPSHSTDVQHPHRRPGVPDWKKKWWENIQPMSFIQRQQKGPQVRLNLEIFTQGKIKE